MFPAPPRCTLRFIALAAAVMLPVAAVSQRAAPLAVPGAAVASPALAVSLPATPSAAPYDTGCCGPVTPAGKHLQQLLDGMNVDRLWQSGMHIEWNTGIADRPSDFHGSDTHTHCSAFAAAVGDRMGIYMLRPPDHPQTFLASAQGRWFGTSEAAAAGWSSVAGAEDAQRLANGGALVVIVFVSPDEHKPGHIAIVRPAMKTSALLAEEGPETTQAGAINFSNGNAKLSFAKHKGAWPDGVRIYAHRTSFESLNTVASR